MNKARATYLFKRYFNDTATKIEVAELMEWLSTSENAKEVQEQLDQAWESYEEKETVFSDIKSREILHHVLQNEISSPEFVNAGNHKISRSIWLNMAAAVAVFLFLAFCGYLLKHNTPKEKPGAMVSKIQNDVLPGGNKAILTLSNGKKISLGDSSKGLISLQGQTKVIKVNSGLLNYDAGKRSKIASKTRYNTISTPRGGQYKVVLPDGSKVWLNAASSIRFPTAFTGRQRQVNITGEAYFEIAKNAEMPFVVGAGKVKVRVLGTRFNLNAYKDEAAIRTTLLAGSIKLEMGEKGKVLQPGQQADVDKRFSSIRIKKAKLEEAIAWKNGMFHFEEDGITQIMRQVSRWYDVKITYEGMVPSGHYTGIISRNTRLSEVLKVLATSGIHFKIQGKEILVQS